MLGSSGPPSSGGAIASAKRSTGFASGGGGNNGIAFIASESVVLALASLSLGVQAVSAVAAAVDYLTESPHLAQCHLVSAQKRRIGLGFAAATVFPQGAWTE